MKRFPYTLLDSVEFKMLFADNLANFIKVIKQQKINEMYTINVFPKGKMKELYESKIKSIKLEKLNSKGKRAATNTTDTLKMLGIDVEYKKNK